jgi:acyl carrier protein
MNPARTAENPIFRTVAIIVSSISGRVIQSIHKGTPWRDLGVDEIKFGEIVSACEREYGIAIPEADCRCSPHPGRARVCDLFQSCRGPHELGRYRERALRRSPSSMRARGSTRAATMAKPTLLDLAAHRDRRAG